MNEETRGTLLGMVLGDGYITEAGSLVIKHSEAQRSYLEHKAGLLHRALGGKAPSVLSIDNSGYPGCKMSKADSYFRILRGWLYQGGTKRVAGPFLRFLTLHGLALWWMDDGSLYMKRRDGRVHAREGILSLYVSREECLIVAARIEELTSVYPIPVHHKGKFRLRFNTGMLQTFIPKINQYAAPGMEYKFDLKYR